MFNLISSNFLPNSSSPIATSKFILNNSIFFEKSFEKVPKSPLSQMTSYNLVNKLSIYLIIFLSHLFNISIIDFLLLISLHILIIIFRYFIKILSFSLNLSTESISYLFFIKLYKKYSSSSKKYVFNSFSISLFSSSFFICSSILLSFIFFFFKFLIYSYCTF